MQINQFDKGDPMSTYLDSKTDLSLKKKLMRLSLWVLLLVLSLALYLADWELESRQEALEDSIQHRLQVLAEGRADVLSNWLSSLASQGNQIIQSDLFRLYASEIDLIEDDISYLLSAPVDSKTKLSPDLTQLAEQLPLMQNLLGEFSQYAGFASGRVINKSGQSYIATNANTVPLDQEQVTLAKMAISEDRVLYSPAKASGNGLVIQLYLPIRAPAMADPLESPVAVLQLNKNISGKINEILSDTPLADKGEKTRLLQQSGTNLVELVPWLPGEIYPLTEETGISLDLSFAHRPSPRNEREVFSLAVKVPQLDWWILQETDYATAMTSLKNHRRTTISMIILGSLLLLVLIGALWWKLIGTENKKVAESFKKLAEQIEDQRQLLENINGNLSELIALKDNRGLYVYVNQAFATAVGRSQDEIVGLDDSAVFGFDSAKRLESSDQDAIKTRQQVNVSETLYLQSERHNYQITKAPLTSTTGAITGIVSSFRDVTELLENQRRSEQARRQTIEVLAKAVELNDPYLAGHSRLMSQVALETAKALSCPGKIQATVETASYLSQLGKMFIDSELLQKPAALTAEEKKRVEKHIGHTTDILRGIEFELPIQEAIEQMNEHLDGSGYPAGLKDQQIDQPARILAVVNSFCAMIRPRSYRPARPVDEIISILQQESNKYDVDVVLALQKVVNSSTGERILNNAPADQNS